MKTFGKVVATALLLGLFWAGILGVCWLSWNAPQFMTIETYSPYTQQHSWMLNPLVWIPAVLTDLVFLIFIIPVWISKNENIR